MPILAALQAFLSALDGGPTPVGRAQDRAAAPVDPAPAPVQQPLGPVVEALAVRVGMLEGQIDGLKSYARTEADRAQRAGEAAGRAVYRLRESMVPECFVANSGDDVPGDDAGAGGRAGVHAVPARVAEPPRPRTGEEIREAARIALHGS